MASISRTQSVIRCGSVVFFTLLLLTAWTALAQPFTFNDVAFIGGLKTNTPPPPPWAPTNAYGWWHADIMTSNNGDAILSWPDSASTHDFYVLSNNAVNAPFFTNDATVGKCVWWRDQTNIIGLSNAFGSTLSLPFTYIFVVSFLQKDTSAFEFLTDSIDGTDRKFINEAGPPTHYIQAGSVSGGMSGASDFPQNWMVLTVFMNGATSGYIRTNGVLYVYGTTGTEGMAGITLGHRYGPQSDRSLYGGVAEFVFYNSELATNDLQWVENNLKSKYGF